MQDLRRAVHGSSPLTLQGNTQKGAEQGDWEASGQQSTKYHPGAPRTCDSETGCHWVPLGLKQPECVLLPLGQ